MDFIVEASVAADAYYFSTSVLETSMPLCGTLQRGFIIAALAGSVSTATATLSSLSTAPEKDAVYTFILTVKLAIEL